MFQEPSKQSRSVFLRQEAILPCLNAPPNWPRLARGDRWCRIPRTNLIVEQPAGSRIEKAACFALGIWDRTFWMVRPQQLVGGRDGLHGGGAPWNDEAGVTHNELVVDNQDL